MSSFERASAYKSATAKLMIDDTLGYELDICRICRCEGTEESPLCYPCRCTGSIKYIHRECLVEWLICSRTTYCEICKHQIQFENSK